MCSAIHLVNWHVIPADMLLLATIRRKLLNIQMPCKHMPKCTTIWYKYMYNTFMLLEYRVDTVRSSPALPWHWLLEAAHAGHSKCGPTSLKPRLGLRITLSLMPIGQLRNPLANGCLRLKTWNSCPLWGPTCREFAPGHFPRKYLVSDF
jgi:hypothetical protein